MQVDLDKVEDAARELYVRALKILPPDIKAGFDRLRATETSAQGKRVLDTLLTNIKVAERTDNLLCQDTGVPIYNVVIGRGVDVDGPGLKEALRRGCARATREHSLRSSIVHPITRANEHTSCGIEVPVIHVDFSETPDELVIEMIPKGSGSENNSFLKMAIPAEGVDAIKTFVIDCVHRRRREDLPADDRRRGHRRHFGPVRRAREARCDARARHALLRPRRREARGAALRRRQSSRRRSAGAGRRFDRVRRPHRARRDAYHDEPGRRQHAVPFGAARERDVHAGGYRLRILGP